MSILRVVLICFSWLRRVSLLMRICCFWLMCFIVWVWFSLVVVILLLCCWVIIMCRVVMSFVVSFLVSSCWSVCCWWFLFVIVWSRKVMVS